MASENDNGSTTNADPVIAWLEEVRDFEGSTPRARELAQHAIDRLTTSAPSSRPTGDEKIDRIVEASREETERGRKERRQ